MPEYTYVARDRAGRAASGVIVAEDDAQLRHILRSNDLFITEFRVQGKEGKAGGGTSIFDWNLRPKQQDMVIATRQIASMIRAGVPLVGAIEVVESQTIKPALRDAFIDVRQGVIDGQPLSDAMRRHPKVFPTLVVSLVNAGEASGELDTALEVAAEQLDRDLALRKKIKTASAYPKVVVLASVGTVAAMLTFVVPVFAGVYSQMHAELPSMTLALVGGRGLGVALARGTPSGQRNSS